jgi:hypothetical protein
MDHGSFKLAVTASGFIVEKRALVDIKELSHEKCRILVWVW